MPRPRKTVMASLEKKGFVVSERDHSYFIYHTRAGKKTIVKTKVSHSGKDISKQLISLMAKQCKLTMPEFHDLIDCPLSQEKYEERLSEQGLT